jgi:hypothetical protein
MQKMAPIIQSLKNLVQLSIEQLYALVEICTRFAQGTFKEMTATEKMIFESMPLDDQNLFHALFSFGGKPITDPFGVQSFIQPAKQFTKEINLENPEPVPGYVLPGTIGIKRPAEQSSSKRPSKKRRLEDREEEEQSDDVTFNESDNESDVETGGQ